MSNEPRVKVRCGLDGTGCKSVLMALSLAGWPALVNGQTVEENENAPTREVPAASRVLVQPVYPQVYTQQHTARRAPTADQVSTHAPQPKVVRPTQGTPRPIDPKVSRPPRVVQPPLVQERRIPSGPSLHDPEHPLTPPPCEDGDCEPIMGTWSGPALHDESEEPPDHPRVPTPGGRKTSPGCFIATAAYGTPLAAEVQVLKGFRDRYLLTNRLGRSIVEDYYHYSPPIAGYIAERPALRATARAFIYPMVYCVKHPLHPALVITLLLAALLTRAVRSRAEKIRPGHG